MGKFLRWSVGFLGLGLLALGIIVSDSSCLPTFRIGGKNDLLQPMSEIYTHQEQVLQKVDAAQRRREAKRQVAEEVIAGRLSVAEALEAFRRLEEDRLPDITKQWALKRWKKSEDEYFVEGILYYVEQVLADRPDGAAAVIGRLKKEFHELLADRKKRPTPPVEPQTKEWWDD